MISITGMSKADVLAGLYNASKPLGMGVTQSDPSEMSTAEAEETLQRTSNFDYLKGRVMKVDLSGDEFEEWLYDRDNGPGAAQRVIDNLM